MIAHVILHLCVIYFQLCATGPQVLFQLCGIGELQATGFHSPTSLEVTNFVLSVLPDELLNSLLLPNLVQKLVVLCDVPRFAPIHLPKVN